MLKTFSYRYTDTYLSINEDFLLERRESKLKGGIEQKVYHEITWSPPKRARLIKNNLPGRLKVGLERYIIVLKEPV